MSAPIEEECANCRFARVHDERRENYTCHRHAPPRFDLDFLFDALRSIAVSQVVISDRDRRDGILNVTGSVLDYMSIWPVVDSCDWCGEYEPKKNPRERNEEPSPEHRAADLTELRKTLGRLYGIVKDMEREAHD